MLESEPESDRAKKTAFTLKNKEERSKSFVRIVENLLNTPKREKLEDAIRVIQAIDVTEERTKPLIKLIDKFFHTLPFEKGEVIPVKNINEVLDLVNDISDERERNKALQRIVIGLARHDMVKNALKIADTIPDQDARAYAKSCAVNMLIQNDNYDGGIEVCHNIRESGYREDAIRYVVKGYLDHGMYEEAIAFIETLESSVEKNRAAKIVLNDTIANQDSEREQLLREKFSLL